MAFDVRRVVTGHDGAGRAVFLSDGPPPATAEMETGIGVSDLIWIDGPPAGAAAGGDPDGPRLLEPPPGGYVWRVVRIPVSPPGTPEDMQWLRVSGEDESAPGMHATDTLDFMVVLDGQVVLGLDDGEYVLGAGDTVVQRGTRHRWKVIGDRPCTWSVVMVRPAPGAAPAPVALAPRPTGSPTGLAPRRIVTGADASGRSYAVVDGETPVVFVPPGSTGSVMVDLWQTGGALGRPEQGGDPDGPWELDPVGEGVAFRVAQLPAARALRRSATGPP
jgi:quercetin dioxygenase-like cupin family protein